MSQIIILRGPLGIGKTTVAKELVRKLQGKQYSIDDILSKHNLDSIPEGEPCIPEKNFLKVNEFLLEAIKEESKLETPLVIEGNFYFKSVLEDLEKKLKNNLIHIFTLKAPIEICIERDRHRVHPHGKWAAIAVHNLVSSFDAGEIITNEDKDIDEVVEIICSKLSSNKTV